MGMEVEEGWVMVEGKENNNRKINLFHPLRFEFAKLINFNNND
jgi:hypothetical protein